MATPDEYDSPYENALWLHDDLRQQISGTILERAPLLTSDTVAIFPYSGPEPLEIEYCNRVGQLLVQLVAMAVREGRVDARSGFVADLNRMALERRLSAQRLFTFVYLLERTILDELALSDSLGATAEPWPVVAQLVRRASFDVLAHTEAHPAAELAERVRATVSNRLGFTDHRTDRLVEITVSGAVVNTRATTGHTMDAEHLIVRAEEALERAKQQGRNQIVRV